MANNVRTSRYLVAGVCFAALFSLVYFWNAGDFADVLNSGTSGNGAPIQKQAFILHRNAQNEVVGVEFSTTDVSPDQIAALREHAMLQEISFYECRGIDALVDAELVKSETITAVHFVRSRIDDDNLARLSGMPAVEQLTLGSVDVTAKGIAALGNWGNLKHLTVEGSIELSALEGLSELDHLEQLNVAIGEGEAQQLVGRAFPELRRLRISDVEFGDADLALLPEWKNLEVFDFPAENITDTGAAQFRKFPALKELNLMYSQVGDAGVQDLGHLKNLESVSLMDCTNVTDRGIGVFATMPVLNRLLLLRSGVTGAGLPQLAPSTSLRYVGIGETQASAEEVANLAASMPNCEVDRIQTLPR